METANFKLDAEEYEKILFILSSLNQRLQSEYVSLIHRNGQEIGRDGNSRSIDLQALASLAASNLAATFGLASLIGEREFERIFHQGEKTSILIMPIGEHAFLLLLFALPHSERKIDSKSVRQAALILDDILVRCARRGRESN